ncbi:MAG: metalloregulator ArsR/SmtB family transcription factor [Candidatus Eisenbacteria bacterium]|nr:metalloregulator ArsR/SmtB family transcription factor [Candidatus Eisenbacteria bacterium]
MNARTVRPLDLLACLGDASRYELVLRLLDGERCVSDLARAVGLSQSCTTRHLQTLSRNGLVHGTRQGKRVLFKLCLERPAVGDLLRWVTAPASGLTASLVRRSKASRAAARGSVARRASSGGGPMEREAEPKPKLGPSSKRPSPARRPAHPPAHEPSGVTAEMSPDFPGRMPEETLNVESERHGAAADPARSSPEAEPVRGRPRFQELEDYLL